MSEWTQVYAPIAGSPMLSAVVAALPLLVVALLLGVWRAPAWKAAAFSLATAFATAVFAYGMPVRLAVAATGYGAAFGLFPIGWLVYSAILLFDVTVDAGCFEAIKRSLRGVSGDQRLLVLLIAFCFGAFIEGTSGFGTPVAVSASLLVGLGLPAFTAAALCLVANTAPVAFGALATPIVTLAGVTGLPLQSLSSAVGRLSPLIAVTIPMYLMVLMAGWSGAMEVWPAALACGLSFVVACGAAQAQTAGGSAPAQTAGKNSAPAAKDARPNFEGTWNLVGDAGGILVVDWENGISDQEHAAQGHKNVPKPTKWPTVGLTDHKLPYQPWALAFRNERTNNYLHPQRRDQVDTNTLCYPTGMPHLMYRGAMQIHTFDDSIAMLWENAHGYRVIPTDGRAHLSGKVKLWQGDSVGHWEGNSLVVDVTNLNGYAWLDFVGNFITDAAHLTERFTLVDAATLNYKLTIDDPQAFTEPVKLDVNFSRRGRDAGAPTADDIWEFACWEGNKNLADLPR